MVVCCVVVGVVVAAEVDVNDSEDCGIVVDVLTVVCDVVSSSVVTIGSLVACSVVVVEVVVVVDTIVVDGDSVVVLEGIGSPLQDIFNVASIKNIQHYEF